ncbi:hypothetical protein [Novosphingobium sp. 9]|uniref:hypothetical protein n=1 Tax=Novosphingobium sp. 9 TaxID=2025349 RepID=UPI0021B51FDC|nr:hypothetical protein [Novosphingobium sp. 9]
MQTMKRRALVLTDDTARHWFRRSLPPHVRRRPVEAEGWAAPDGVAAENAQAKRRWNGAGRDWQRFAQAYGACFAAITIYLT